MTTHALTPIDQDLAIDPVARIVRVRGRIVPLSRSEYRLLGVLATDPTRVFTREELLKSVFGYPPSARTRTLDTHASRLRMKLGSRAYVVNVWGVGYRLTNPPATIEAA